jgi:hypothetical protein
MDIEKLKQRDAKTLVRIKTAQKSANVLKLFFEKGFKSFDAIKAVVLNFYPDLNEKKLWDFWHFRIIDEEIVEVLEDVFDKLKAE